MGPNESHRGNARAHTHTKHYRQTTIAFDQHKMIIPNRILNLLNKRSPEQITTIFIHHSVVRPDADIQVIAQAEPFLTVGYNAYVRKNPQTGIWECQQGRPLTDVPAAQYGMNVEGYAICLAGNYQPGGASFLNRVEDTALDVILAQIHAVHSKCPNLQYLAGHRDVATIMAKRGKYPGAFSTACPGDLLYERLHDLRVMSGLHTRPELL